MKNVYWKDKKEENKFRKSNKDKTVYNQKNQASNTIQNNKTQSNMDESDESWHELLYSIKKTTGKNKKLVELAFEDEYFKNNPIKSDLLENNYLEHCSLENDLLEKANLINDDSENKKDESSKLEDKNSDFTAFEFVEKTDYIADYISFVDNNMIKASRKCKPDAYIDLHGLTQKEAYVELYNFIIQSKKNRKLILLIITGKGYRFKNKDKIDEINFAVGALRTGVPIWLKTHDIYKNMIKSICLALQNKGGEGAYMIFLKK